MGPEVALPGIEVGATVGDCDATEFFPLRDRGWAVVPWRGDLEANWKARGDAFLASVVRTGDVVNMVVRAHGGGSRAKGSVYPSRRGQAGHIICMGMRENGSSVVAHVSPVGDGGRRRALLPVADQRRPTGAQVGFAGTPGRTASDRLFGLFGNGCPRV